MNDFEMQESEMEKMEFRKDSDTKISMGNSQYSDSSDQKELHDFVAPRHQITFSWCNINAFSQASSRSDDSKVCHSKKHSPVTEQILKNVNGVAFPGELLVIMGSSGAGKTTLLNCMTFRNLRNLTISGLICVNKTPVVQNKLAAISGYVQQDDLFISYLTPREHLIFQALLKMDSKYTYEEKMQKVEQVLEDLCLKKCENSKIGLPGVVKGISGGERKRLAFASELLTNPPLLFCDEPTTGLDSFMSLNVVQILRDIARSGRTVIVTLHQPSSEIYQLFDKLYLMTEGRTAFLGTTEEAKTFFTKLQAPCPKNFNPSDHFIQILSIIPGKEEACKRTVQSICNAFETSKAGIKLKKESEKIINSVIDFDDQWTNNNRFQKKEYRASWLEQLQMNFWRVWISTRRNPDLTTRRLIIVLLEASLIALIYNGQKLDQFGIQNINGVIFFFLVIITYPNVMCVLSSFCGELPIFIKEHKDGLYRVDVYYIAKIFCDLPFAIFLTCLNTSIVYFVVGLNPNFDRFLTALLISILLCLAAQGVGYLMSTIAPTVQVAPFLVSFFVTPFLLLAGVYMNLASTPSYLAWLSDLSWFKYANEAYLINQWSDIRHIKCDRNSTVDSVCIDNGIEVLINHRISISEFWPALSALLVLAIFFRLIAFCILLFKASCKD